MEIFADERSPLYAFAGDAEQLTGIEAFERFGGSHPAERRAAITGGDA